jgi:hypothetical protein
MAGEFLTLDETASTLGVSTRHARRLADSGAITRVARGLIDRGSVDRYLHSQRQGRTRAWAEHTAWGAVAILSGQDADWLGETQASRLRSVLRETNDADDLLTRMRDRARVQTYLAHRAALPRLRERVVSTNQQLLGITDVADDSIDGYLPASGLDDVVRSLGLRADGSGSVVLRTTEFEFDRVRDLIATRTVAALDAGTSTDPRQRGIGRRTIRELLEAYR